MGDCVIAKKNMGASQCNKLPGRLVSMITTPNSFEIPAGLLVAGQEIALLAYLQAATLAGQATRIYKWPEFVSMENVSKEATYEDTVYSYLPVDDGQYRWKPAIRENFCTHKAMFTHRANSGRIIAIDHLGQLFLTKKSSGAGAGFLIQTLHTEKLLLNDGSVATKSPFLVALKNNAEIDKSGIVISLDSVGELNRIIDLEVEVISAVANQVVIKVTAECDGTEIEGLSTVVGEDIFIYTTAGVSQLITGIVDNGDGQYTITRSSGSYVDGYIQLADADNLSIEPYEQPKQTLLDIAS